MVSECRYKQRAGRIIAFYKSNMTLRIREIREANGWSQEVLAEKANISRSQLAQIESEARPVNTLRLSAIAKALGKEVYDLFELTPEDSEILDITRNLESAHKKTILDLARVLSSS